MSTWFITAKDLRLLMKDPRALVMLLLLPLLFIAIVGMSTGQFLTREDNSEQFKIAVIDNSKSEISQSLLAEMAKIHEFIINPVDSQDAAVAAMRQGDAMLVMEIGPKFEERVDDLTMTDIFNTKTGLATVGVSPLDLRIEAKSTTGGAGKLMEAALTSLVLRFIAPYAANKNPITRNWLKSPDDTESEEAGPTPISASVAAKHDKKPSTAFLWVVPGFTVMFAFFLVNIMARSFMIERDQGTLRRLMMAPIGTTSVLLGKTIPFYVTSVLQCSLLFLSGRVLFGMPWGAQPMYLIPVILCTSAAAASLGLLLSTIVRTDQQIASYGTALILVLSSISGCFFPRELFPKLMKQISLFTPHAWSLKAFDAVLTQPVVDARLIATCCGMLLLFTTICFTVGWWRFRAIAKT